MNSNISLFNALQSINVFASEAHLHDFNFISASIGKLLPELDFEKHLAIAKESAFYQMLSVRDETNFPLIKRMPKPDTDFSKKILVTFHYSSYRLFNSLLISWSVPFKVVADANYINKQGKTTVESYHKIAQELNVKSYDFEIINAEDRTVILKCLEAAKQGFALVFYADGNSGVGGMTMKKNNMLNIPFLQSSIYVRKGIVTLASLLKIPITTITIQRDIIYDTIEFDIRENISFPKDRKNEEEVRECTIAIYQNLQDQLYKNPGQWEGWFYYHNFMDFEATQQRSIKNQIVASKTIFNHRFYGIGVFADKVYYILNKRTLRLTPISEEFFNELLYIIQNNRIRKEVPVFASLITEGILTVEGKN